MTAITGAHPANGPAASYTEEDTLNLAAGSFLVSNDANALFLGGTSQTYDLSVDGMIHAPGSGTFAGIFVDETVTANILLSNTGVVAGEYGIRALGLANITNSGTIVGTTQMAIAQVGTGDLTIRNIGSIQGANYGIGFNSDALGIHTILNEGVIAVSPNSSVNVAIFNQTGNDSQTLITNSGTIKGDIYLLGGDDSVTTTDGKIIGLIELGDGENQFYGGRLGEHVIGGLDADFLDGGLGNDTLEGGAGDDVYNVDSQDDIIIEAAGGTGDVVQATVNYILAADVEIEFMFAMGTGDFGLAGNAISATTMNGNAGDNVLTSDHDDGLVDVLEGFGGNDLFILGADVVDTVTDTEGVDKISSTVSRDLALYAGVENLEIIGNGLADLFGTNVANSLVGNSNKNVIEASGGSDLIIGREGQDTISGGLGKDTFGYKSTADSGPGAAQRDTITDFKSRTDKIDVTEIDAINGGADNAFILDARGTAASAVARGHIGYFWSDKAGTANDMTVLRFNTDSDVDVEMSIALDGLITLRAGDFAL